MLEKDLINKYKKWIYKTDPQAWIYKTHDSTTRGIPDLHVTIQGKSVWIELKHKHKLQLIQYLVLKEIEQAGGIALLAIDNRVCRIEDFDFENHSMYDFIDINKSEITSLWKKAL